MLLPELRFSVRGTIRTSPGPYRARQMHTSSPTDKASRPVWIDGAAGALAGCVSRFLIGPLDVIKIRFQVQLEPIKNHAAAHQKRISKYTGFTQALTTILKEEGVRGLWRGTVPGLLLTVPYTAVQFVTLEQFQHAAARLGLTANPATAPLASFVSGAFAGAAATLASYPFDLLRTTLAAQGEPKVYRGMFDAAGSIIRRQGFKGLYNGLNVTLLEIMPYAALQFGLFDTFKLAWDTAKVKATHKGKTAVEKHSQLENFTCGLMAGLFAKLATHPLDVVKKRYQVAGLERSLSYGARIEPQFAVKSLQQGLLEIYQREGVQGLWKGSIPSIIKAAPAAAITFTAYHAIMAWLVDAFTKAPKKANMKK